jgi:hypothetical protein
VPADGPTTPAKKVELDFVNVLLAALRERGLEYKAVVTSTAYDVEVTGRFGDASRDLRVTNREVVLPRADVVKSTLEIGSPQRGRFAARLTVPLATGNSTSLPWTWASVDVTVAKHTFRFVTTHLDSLSPANQVSQAAELLARPGATKLPTAFVGDYTSLADGSGTPTFGQLVSAGLVDAWGVARGSEPGYSCCQAEDIATRPPPSTGGSTSCSSGETSASTTSQK